MKILAISGSVRRGSFNTCLIHEAASVAPEGTEVQLFDKLSELPIFDPELDESEAPAEVVCLRRAAAIADAILISSPEYVHGVPGGLKNALDWLVGSGEFDGKPVAIIIASTSEGTWVRDALHEILGVMSGWRVVKEGCFTVPGIKARFDTEKRLIDEGVRTKLRQAMEVLARNDERSSE
jgi:NAD(P)H-dependent FMN reductase